MICPKLTDLPPPPPGKHGWPWTEDTKHELEKVSDGTEWPKISIVTPNYNYGHFLEETIRSILLQGYPNLEYIVIDGNSNDNSIEVIKKYERWIHYFVSEKDHGQTSAINKGLKHCSGDIFNWINSDDQLLPNALYTVARLWLTHKPDMVIASSIGIELSSGCEVHRLIPTKPKKPLDLIIYGQFGLQISQPSTFLRLSLLQEIGYLNEELHYSFDWAFYLKSLITLRNLNIKTSSLIISKFLVHPEAKTIKFQSFFIEEGQKVFQEIYPQLSKWEQLKLKFYIKHNKFQQLVEGAIIENTQNLSKLTALLINNPQILVSRFFLGAFRREMLLAIFKALNKIKS